MTRAGLLCAMANPFLLRFWLDRYERFRTHLSKLYVNLVAPPHVPKTVAAECYRMLIEAGADVSVAEHVQHGQSIANMLMRCEEDLVLLLEDDAFVRNGDAVGYYFSEIERGDVDLVGSPRTSCSPRLAQALCHRWHVTGQAYDKGPNWWPCFLFTKRSILTQTDQHFTAKGWKKGEVVETLDWEAPEDLAGDTFVWASMQLRAMRLKTRDVPQGHSHPDDLEHRERGMGMWSAPWVHVGSLSPLVSNADDPPFPPDQLAEQERRQAWMELICEQTIDRLQSLPVCTDGSFLASRRKKFGMDGHRIDAYKAAYGDLL